ncbi:MAG: hypothetical protein PHP03_02300 [Candidatus Pacebacteria bacterium]|nr:hypothetical protein [Candidatus Paceibacterota bacterium]
MALIVSIPETESVVFADFVGMVRKAAPNTMFDKIGIKIEAKSIVVENDPGKHYNGKENREMEDFLKPFQAVDKDMDVIDAFVLPGSLSNLISRVNAKFPDISQKEMTIEVGSYEEETEGVLSARKSIKSKKDILILRRCN